jgi:hypothetical protein
VTTCSPGIPLTNGVVFCDVKSWLTGRRFVSLLFSDHCDPLINGSKELDDVLLHLRRQVNDGKWKYIEIRPVAIHVITPNLAKVSPIIFIGWTCVAMELPHDFHGDCV